MRPGPTQPLTKLTRFFGLFVVTLQIPWGIDQTDRYLLKHIQGMTQWSTHGEEMILVWWCYWGMTRGTGYIETASTPSQPETSRCNTERTTLTQLGGILRNMQWQMTEARMLQVMDWQATSNRLMGNQRLTDREWQTDSATSEILIASQWPILYRQPVPDRQITNDRHDCKD